MKSKLVRENIIMIFYQITLDNIKLESYVSHETHHQQVNGQYNKHHRDASQETQSENYLIVENSILIERKLMRNRISSRTSSQKRK